MEGIFAEILNMSMISCIVIVAVMIIRQIFRRAPKAFFCILWAFVGFRLICPFTLQSVLCLIPDSQPITEEVFLHENVPVKSEFPTEKYETSLPQIPDDNTEIQNDGKQPVYSVPTEEKKPEVSLTETLPTPQGNNEFLHFIPYIWAIWAILMFAGALIRYLMLIRRLHGSVADENGIYYSDKIDTPFILGVISPKIYLPYETGETDKEYILAHERAHIHRLDYLWKPIGFIILCLHWFNPLVWVAFRLFCKDIELSCDERAVRDYSQEKRKAYSHTLVNFSVQQKSLNYLPLGFGNSEVKERVVNVLSYKKPAFWVIMVCIIVIAGISVFLMTNPISSKDNTAQRNSVPTDFSDEIATENENISVPNEETTKTESSITDKAEDYSDKTLTEKDKLSIQQEADALIEEKKTMLTESSEPVSEEVINFLEKYPELKNQYDKAESILDKCMKLYPNLSDEQYKELLEVRKSDGWLTFPYQEAVIVGKIDASSPRITLDDVKRVISENSDSGFAIIVQKLSEIQPPDSIGGSGTHTAQFFLDDEGNERIIAVYVGLGRSLQILYYHSDEYEQLYMEIRETDKKVADFLEKYPELKYHDKAEDILYECMELYPNLSDEQYKELFQVRMNAGWIQFPYKEAVIAGKINSSFPRMTLDDVKKVIEENYDSGFDNIVAKLARIQPADQVGGSGRTTAQFFLDDEGNERIVAVYDDGEHDRQILYYHSGEYEPLYAEKLKIPN